MVRMREKLLRKIRQLEEREVSFDDEAKEIFYINHEVKLKKALLEIEKSLHKYGALLDVDDDLEAFYNNISTEEVNITDTGNEFLNQRLSKLINEKISRKEKIVTPTFDEIRDIMCEIRAEHGSSSGIPDPDKEWESFLNRLENVAFVVVRSHQNLIASQFLEHVDQYIPEPDRPKASKLPELSPSMKELLTADGDVLPDEIFHMEMQAAAKLELENPQTTTDEDIDLVVDDESDSVREDEDVDDEELACDETDETDFAEPSMPPQCNDSADSSHRDFQAPSAYDEIPTVEEARVESNVKSTSPQSVNVFKLLAEKIYASASSNIHQPGDNCKVNTESGIAEDQVIERVSCWLQTVEPEKIPTIEMNDDGSQKVETQRRGVKRECYDDDKADAGHTSGFSDDEIEFLGVFTKSPECEPVAAECTTKRRCPDLACNSTGSMSPPDTDLIPTDE